MRIVTGYTHRPLSERIRSIDFSSEGILLTAIYISGIVSGCSVYLSSGSVRNAVSRLFSLLTSETMPYSSFLIIGAVVSLAAGSLIFGAGLSAVGRPCIYISPFVVGVGTGLLFLAYFASSPLHVVMPVILLLPFWCGAVCGVLYMCEYAFDMTSELQYIKLDREAGETKKYTLRIILLTLSVMLMNLINALIWGFLIRLR